LLGALVEREARRGVRSDRILLAGFSQGGVMALHTGLCYGQRLAGILALSCYLPLAEWIEQERSRANVATPVLMAHGRYDDLVPVAFGHDGYSHLAALGQPVEWQEYPIGHEVAPDEIAAIGRWIGSRLTRGAAESP